MTPFLSIIIPIYKIKEEYLRACFDSLLKQDNDNFQIIAVDDGSPAVSYTHLTLPTKLEV